MYYTEDLYDDSLLIEDLLDDGVFDEDYYDEDLLDDDLLDDDFSEDFAERRRGRRGRRFKRLSPRISRNVKKRSNFGRTISGNSKKYVTKADLKVALNTISKDVNGLKKTALSNGKTLKAVDGKYSSIVKDIARKDTNQTKVLKNMQTMNMLGSLLNKPKFDETNLEVELKQGDSIVSIPEGASISVKEKEDDKTVNFDQTLSLLLPMLTTQGDSGSGKSSNDMMLPLILLMTQNNSSSSSDSNIMLPLVLMMMNK